MNIEHDSFKNFNPITAGFCHILKDRVSCFGRSFSLGMSSEEKQDTLDATKQLLGIEAMLKLL